MRHGERRENRLSSIPWEEMASSRAGMKVQNGWHKNDHPENEIVLDLN
jgi:hypothetical protein